MAEILYRKLSAKKPAPLVPLAERRTRFEAFCRAHATYVEICLRLHRIPPSRIEDLRQDVFLKAYEKGLLPECADASRKYLYVIAALLAANDRRRKAHRLPALPIGLDENDAENYAVDPACDTRLDEELDAKRVLHRLHNSLPPKLRKVLKLLYEGHATQEGARRLGLTIKAYNTRLQIVRQECERILTGQRKPINVARLVLFAEIEKRRKQEALQKKRKPRPRKEDPFVALLRPILKSLREASLNGVVTRTLYVKGTDERTGEPLAYFGPPEWSPPLARTG